VVKTLHADEDAQVVHRVNDGDENEEGNEEGLEAPLRKRELWQAKERSRLQERNAVLLKKPQDQAEPCSDEQAEDQCEELDGATAKDGAGHDRGKGGGSDRQIGRIDAGLVQSAEVHAGEVDHARFSNGDPQHQDSDTTDFRWKELSQAVKQSCEPRLDQAE